MSKWPAALFQTWQNTYLSLFFLHGFELFFIMLGESRVAADAALVNTEE